MTSTTLKNINRDRDEFEHWKTTVDILQDENILLKNKLAFLIQKHISDPGHLELAESFQVRFLNMDDLLKSFKLKIIDFFIKQNRVNDPHGSVRLQSKNSYSKLKKMLEEIKLKFVKLKLDLELFIRSVTIK